MELFLYLLLFECRWLFSCFVVGAFFCSLSAIIDLYCGKLLKRENFYTYAFSLLLIQCRRSILNREKKLLQKSIIVKCVIFKCIETFISSENFYPESK